jgi:hypothetical protein
MMKRIILQLCYLVPGVLIVGVSREASSANPLELTLGAKTPSVLSQARSPRGEYSLLVRVQPTVRSVAIRVRLPDAGNANGVETVRFELYESGGSSRAPLAAGVASVSPRNGANGPYPTFAAIVKLQPRDADIVWLAKLSTPADDKKIRPPLRATLRMDADARITTDRERDLMRWRSTVDPDQSPDAVRRKIGELSDEEVRFYTGFKDRANFLQMWQRAKLSDQPRDEDGGLVITDENRGLVSVGNPLPDGKYLHHNGIYQALP